METPRTKSDLSQSTLALGPLTCRQIGAKNKNTEI